MHFRRYLALSILSVAAVAPSSRAANLVSNGGFESWTGGYTDSNGTHTSAINNNGLNGYSKLTDWSVSPHSGQFLAWLMQPGQADTGGSWNTPYPGWFTIWGQGNGGPDFVPATSPDGGNFLVMDGADNYNGNGIDQTINGLVNGQQYEVSFYWATGQQYGFDGPTWDKGLTVSLGSESHTTALQDDIEHGFTDWKQTKLLFTAQGTSQVLNFLALGEPNGVPPLVLLDGISMQAVPEPSSIAMAALGVAGLAGVGLRRRARLAKNA